MQQIIRQRGTGPRATSSRNPGRHHLGMPGRLHRNPHKADIENAVATERAKVDAVLAQLQAEKDAAEAKARAMEFVAYGAIIGLILLVLIIVSALLIRRRKTTPAAEHASVGPQTRELEPKEPAVLIEIEPAPTGGSKTAVQHPPVGHETRRELEPTEPAVG